VFQEIGRCRNLVRRRIDKFLQLVLKFSVGLRSKGFSVDCVNSLFGRFNDIVFARARRSKKVLGLKVLKRILETLATHLNSGIRSISSSVEC
jgi:hypothetical protein